MKCYETNTELWGICVQKIQFNIPVSKTQLRFISRLSKQYRFFLFLPNIWGVRYTWNWISEMNRLIGLWCIVALYKSSKQVGLNLSQAVDNSTGNFYGCCIHSASSAQNVICLFWRSDKIDQAELSYNATFFGNSDKILQFQLNMGEYNNLIKNLLIPSYLLEFWRS